MAWRKVSRRNDDGWKILEYARSWDSVLATIPSSSKQKKTIFILIKAA